MKYQKAGSPKYYMNSASPWIENWKLIAKKKKFQIRFNPIVTGDRLWARAWFSLSCLITLSIVKKETMITIVVMNE